MAEALARHMLGRDARVESAGIDAAEGAAATKNAVQAMRERNLDISAHRSRSVNALSLLEFDVLVALTPAIAQALCDQGVDPSKIRTLNIPDPYGRALDCYRFTADAIERDLRLLL
jgi:protein-tyrosine-phosphatase